MLTEQQHLENIQVIKCACLVYVMQDVLDAFDGELKFSSRKFYNILQEAVAKEVSHIYLAGEGLCAEGQSQYVEISNIIMAKLHENKFETSEEMLLVMCAVMHLESKKLDLSGRYHLRKSVGFAANNLVECMKKNLTVEFFNKVQKSRILIQSAMYEVLGTYKEQLAAVQELKVENTKRSVVLVKN